MKRYSYGERDYAFGQMILTLRTRIGLTQAGLAALMGVSRRAVAEWEAGSSDGMLRWWDLRHGNCVRVRKAHQGVIQSLKRSLDGSKLASCGNDGAINIWDVESGEHLRTLRRDRPYERLDISGVQGLTEAQKATLRALGAFEKREGILEE